MVSTRNKAGMNKQANAGPSRPASITPDLAAILDGQAKMEQELTGLKKRSADEMEALRQENSCLRRKIEADPTLKGKAKEASEAARSPAFQPRGGKRIQPHPSHLHHHPTNTHPFHPPHSPPIQSTRAYHSPNLCRYPLYHPDPLQHTHHPTHHTSSTVQPTIPPNKPNPPSQPYLHLPRYDHSTHPTPSAPSPPAQTSSPLHRLYRQHPSSCPMGTFHPRPLYWRNRP